jgi:hypothetical protein
MRCSFYVGSTRIDHFVSGLAVVAACGSATSRACAEGPLEGAAVRYEAPAGCPSQSDFEARVRARGPSHAANGAAPSSLQRVHAKVRVQAGRASGSVAIADASGATTTRRIVAASCAEVVDALALIVALAVDPLQQREESGEAAATPGAGEAGATSTDSVTTSPATSSDIPETEKAAPPPSVTNRQQNKEEPATPAEPETEASRRIALARRPHFGVFASGLVASGMMPDAAYGGELAFSVAGGYKRRFVAFAGARAAFAQDITGTEGNARFTWWTTFFGFCLGGRVVTPELWVDGCATLEIGRLGATGSETRNAASAPRLWQAVGPGMRVEWVVARPFALVAGVDGLFPFRRERYLLGPDTAFHTPVVGVRAEAGLGVRF